MVSGIIPVVGVTLPLISYGGSSVLTTMVALGIVMNVSVRRYAY
jgi:rod shape determining protein RodA